jgi:hypothetical protein
MSPTWRPEDDQSWRDWPGWRDVAVWVAVAVGVWTWCMVTFWR